NAQALRCVLQLLQITALPRRTEARPGAGPGQGIQHGCRVAHAAADDMLRREQTAAFTRAVADRHQVTAGPETEQAAGGRRQADRAAPVAGMGHRQDASRNRSGRPAGGAAGTVLEVPGVARIPEQAALGGRAVAELRAAGLAENYQASLAGLAYIAVIGRCPGLAEEPRAVGGDGIGHA